MCAATLHLNSIFDFSYRQNQPYNQSAFHSHPNYEVYYFHSGKCNFLIGDRIYVLAPGDLILMNGMTLHCPKIDTSVEYVRSTIHFEPKRLQPLLGTQTELPILQPFQEMGNHLLRLGEKARTEVERILEHMHEQNTRHDVVGSFRARLAFVDLLTLIYELCLQPLEHVNVQSTVKEKTVQQVVSFLESHYAEDVTLDQVQKHLHVSKYYLSRMFKEVTGVTMFEYVYRRRINQARIEFVLDPSVSVTDVCFRVGFKHLAHFSRVFKELVGVTPVQYKKSLTATTVQ